MLTILDLPKEILLLVADYLGPIGTHNLKLTCSYLNTIFSDKFYWEHYAKTYLKEKFPPIYPSLDHSKFLWESSLYHYEQSKIIWGTFEDIHCCSLPNVHSASIDSVLLMKKGNLCVTGSRDRNLALWNVPLMMKGETNPKAYKLNAHTGWIWDLCENPTHHTLYSASWDKTVKIWALDNGIDLVRTLDCPTTALSVECNENNLISVGLYNGAMLMFDPSTSRPVGTYNFHKKPIYKMVSNNNNIFTISQDRRMGIFDIRTWRAVTQKILTQCLPLSLSACSNFLYVGDSWGNLHLFDPQKFEKIATYNLIPAGRKRQITGIKHTPGCIIVTATDGFVRIFTLTHPPKLILEYPTTGQGIALDYDDQVIAIGTDNNSLNIIVNKNNPRLH